MKKDKKYWNRVSRFYDTVLNKNTAYEKMYSLMRQSLKNDMQVLEIGTGTGLVARNISDSVRHITASDFSDKMIKKAQSIKHADNIKFMQADAFALPFGENSFDTVIASNILHVLPTPEKAVSEIKRVLCPGGLFIAPTYLWAGANLFGKLHQTALRISGLPLHSRWNTDNYKNFIKENGGKITKYQTIKSGFAIGYLECVFE